MKQPRVTTFKLHPPLLDNLYT